MSSGGFARVADKKPISSHPLHHLPSIGGLQRQKNPHVFILLIIFFLLAFVLPVASNLCSHAVYNPDGKDLYSRFYLLGPDSYYNMRLCTETLKNGYYPFIRGCGDGDPLLNYPYAGRYSRPPLFNMITIFSTTVLNKMGLSLSDSLGWSMILLPVLYGALTVFPIYFLGKTFFNKRVGMIAGFLFILTPACFATGHGFNLGLYDHDSLVLLFTTMVVLSLVLAFKTIGRKSLLYLASAAFFAALLQYTWVAGYFILLAVAAFGFFYILLSMFLSVKKDSKQVSIDLEVFRKLVVFNVLVLIFTLPWLVITNQILSFSLATFLTSVLLYVLAYALSKLNPILATMLIEALVIVTIATLYFVSVLPYDIPILTEISKTVFGNYPYNDLVGKTIAEGQPFSLYQIFFLLGPLVFFFSIFGLGLFLVRLVKTNFRPEFVLVLTILLVESILIMRAGRFLNDVLPYTSIFSAFFLVAFFDRVKPWEYPSFSLKKMLVCLLMFFLLSVNIVLTVDASMYEETKKTLSWHNSFFYSTVGESKSWSKICHWLSNQDTILDARDRPAVMSWWDYGFYIASMGGHPVVADNFQDGVFDAANFITAQTEEEAVAVLVNRLNDTLNLSYLKTLNDSTLTKLYHNTMLKTNKSIRYYIAYKKDEVIYPIIEYLANKNDTYYNSTFFSIFYLKGWLLKHFKVVYVETNCVIAKYYEGATIEGYVNTSLSGNLMVYVFDEYGIPHDHAMVVNKSYRVIAPAGYITLGVFNGSRPVYFSNQFFVNESLATWECSGVINYDMEMV